MTNRAEGAFKRLFGLLGNNDNAAEDLRIIRKEIEISDELYLAALKEHTTREVQEAKMAAMKEANKALAVELRKSNQKYESLVFAIGGYEKAGKYLWAADYEKQASILQGMAEDRRKELEEKKP